MTSAWVRLCNTEQRYLMCQTLACDKLSLYCHWPLGQGWEIVSLLFIVIYLLFPSVKEKLNHPGWLSLAETCQMTLLSTARSDLDGASETEGKTETRETKADANQPRNPDSEQTTVVHYTLARLSYLSSHLLPLFFLGIVQGEHCISNK